MAQGDRNISSISEVANDNNGLVRATATLWDLSKRYQVDIREVVRAIELGLDVLDVVELMAEVHDQQLPGGGDMPFQVAVRMKIAALKHADAGHVQAQAQVRAQVSQPAPEPEDLGVVMPPQAPTQARPAARGFGFVRR